MPSLLAPWLLKKGNENTFRLPSHYSRSIGSCSTFLLGPNPSSSSSSSDSSSASDLGGLSGSLYWNFLLHIFIHTNIPLTFTFSLYLALASLASVLSLLYFSVLSFSIRLASAAFNLSCKSKMRFVTLAGQGWAVCEANVSRSAGLV